MIKTIQLIALFFTIITSAQINAVTNNGDEVILFDDNTWKYSNDSLNAKVEIVTNDRIFEKSKKSSFLVKSSKTNIGVWVNPKDWSFSKSDAGSASEYEFKNKRDDIYGMLITESISIPVENLGDIAYDNALSVAPDLKIIEKEFRNVNGQDILMMKMKGTIQGIKFVYFGYYFSNSKGSYQFLTYTSQSLFDEFEEKMSVLLNGLTEY